MTPLKFKDLHFDYCILDEAAGDQERRLCSPRPRGLLSAESSAGDERHADRKPSGRALVLFEFLNPGMLGRGVGLQAGAAARNPTGDNRQLSGTGAAAVHPAATKEQVAKDLPPKTEQTMFCELEPEQRKLYDELREHYRGLLLAIADGIGMSRKDPGARSAAAAPTGGLPSRLDRQDGRTDAAPSWTCSCRS